MEQEKDNSRAIAKRDQINKRFLLTASILSERLEYAFDPRMKWAGFELSYARDISKAINALLNIVCYNEFVEGLVNDDGTTNMSLPAGF